jgi:hypothetical protein
MAPNVEAYLGEPNENRPLKGTGIPEASRSLGYLVPGFDSGGTEQVRP